MNNKKLPFVALLVVAGFLHLGYREGALLRISEVFASENLRHRAVSSLPLRHTSGTTRTNC